MSGDYEDVDIVSFLGVLLGILAACVAGVAVPAFALRKLIPRMSVLESILLVLAGEGLYFYWPRIQHRLSLEWFQSQN